MPVEHPTPRTQRVVRPAVCGGASPSAWGRLLERAGHAFRPQVFAGGSKEKEREGELKLRSREVHPREGKRQMEEPNAL